MEENEIQKLAKKFDELQKITEAQAEESARLKIDAANIVKANAALIQFIKDKGLYLEFMSKSTKMNRGKPNG